jgi:hypothetical protein
MDRMSRLERLVLILLGMGIFASVVLVIALNPRQVRFWPFTVGEFVQLITPLFLVALFIERALEVFITSWRAPESKSLELAAAADSTKELQHSGYKSRTQRIAFIAGTTIGVLVSALGIRALGLFVDPVIFDTLPSVQQTLFTIADVLLTGAILGGGADALHKLVLVFTNFMSSTSELAKKKASSNIQT